MEKVQHFEVARGVHWGCFLIASSPAETVCFAISGINAAQAFIRLSGAASVVAATRAEQGAQLAED
jgi:hypothetical protein